MQKHNVSEQHSGSHRRQQDLYMKLYLCLYISLVFFLREIRYFKSCKTLWFLKTNEAYNFEIYYLRTFCEKKCDNSKEQNHMQSVAINSVQGSNKD